MKYRLSRIEIEVYGARAVLEGSAHDLENGRFWRSDNPRLKEMLDWETYQCIRIDRVLASPFPLLFTNWAIEAGRLVAERLRAAGMNVRIIEEVPFEIYEPAPPAEPGTVI